MPMNVYSSGRDPVEVKKVDEQTEESSEATKQEKIVRERMGVGHSHHHHPLKKWSVEPPQLKTRPPRTGGDKKVLWSSCKT